MYLRTDLHLKISAFIITNYNYHDSLIVFLIMLSFSFYNFVIIMHLFGNKLNEMRRNEMNCPFHKTIVLSVDKRGPKLELIRFRELRPLTPARNT